MSRPDGTRFGMVCQFSGLKPAATTWAEPRALWIAPDNIGNVPALS
ncbi:hypothetical protein [uncultured Fibrella sp.]